MIFFTGLYFLINFLINYFIIPRLAVAIVNILNSLYSLVNIVISCTKMAG